MNLAVKAIVQSRLILDKRISPDGITQGKAKKTSNIKHIAGFLQRRHV